MLDKILLNRKNAYVYIFAIIIVLVGLTAYYMGYQNGKEAAAHETEQRIESLLGDK